MRTEATWCQRFYTQRSRSSQRVCFFPKITQPLPVRAGVGTAVSRSFPWSGPGPTRMRAAAAEAENSRVLPAGGAGVGSWKAQMPPNRKHKPPQGPREGDWGLMGSSYPVSGMAFPSSWRGGEVSNISRDARSLWISACLQGLCTLRICSM